MERAQIANVLVEKDTPFPRSHQQRKGPVHTALLLGPRLGAELRAAPKSLLPKLRTAAREAFIIGVDGGASFAKKLGQPLDLAIGDWDSIRPGGRPPRTVAPEVITLLRDKNDSDLRAALKVAGKRGAREIICAGFSGGRPDQTLGVWLDLAAAAAGELGQVSAVNLRGPGWTAYFLSEKIKSWSAELPIGTMVSVFALNGPAAGVTLQGFRFPLKRARLQPGSVGLSNRTTKRSVNVSVTKGRLIVFRLS